MDLEHPSADICLNYIPEENYPLRSELIRRCDDGLRSIENEKRTVENDLITVEKELNAIPSFSNELIQNINDELSTVQTELDGLSLTLAQPMPPNDQQALIHQENLRYYRELTEKIEKLDKWLDDHNALNMRELLTILDSESSDSSLDALKKDVQREKKYLNSSRENERRRLEERRGMLKERRGRLEAERGRLEERRGKLEERRGKLEERRGRLEADRRTLEERRGKLEERRGKLKDQKQGIIHSITSVFASYAGVMSSQHLSGKTLRDILEMDALMNPIVLSVSEDTSSVSNFRLVGSKGSGVHHKAILSLLETPEVTNDTLIELNKVFADKVFPNLTDLNRLEERRLFPIYSDIIKSIPSTQVKFASSLPENLFAGQGRKVDGNLKIDSKCDFQTLFHQALNLEFKRHTRGDGKNPEKLGLEARRQAFSASVNRVLNAVVKFKARDAWATSATVTPLGVEVQILRVRLTPDWSKVYLTSLISGRLPLQKSDTMESRCENHRNEVDLSVVYKCDSCFLAGVRPPEGLLLLWQLLNTSPDRFSRIYWDVPPVIPGYQVGDYLGAGASAAVFSASKSEDPTFSGIVKVFFSRTDRSNSVGKMVKSEADCLQLLEQHQIPNVPRLIERFEEVKFGKKSKTSVLLMTPLGDPLLHVLRENVDLNRWKKIAELVQRDVLETLRLVHTKLGLKLAHLDIRPANIVLFEEKAYLVDWGLTSKLGSNVGFRGCEAYASYKMQGVILGGTVEVDTSMDMESLFFTLLAILNGGHLKRNLMDSMELLTGFPLEHEMEKIRDFYRPPTTT